MSCVGHMIDFDFEGAALGKQVLVCVQGPKVRLKRERRLTGMSWSHVVLGRVGAHAIGSADGPACLVGPDKQHKA